MCFSKRVRASAALILSLSSFRDIVQAVFALSASSSYLRLLGQDILASTEDCIPTEQLLYLQLARNRSRPRLATYPPALLTSLSFGSIRLQLSQLRHCSGCVIFPIARFVAAFPLGCCMSLCHVAPPKFFVMAHRREQLHGSFCSIVFRRWSADRAKERLRCATLLPLSGTMAYWSGCDAVEEGTCTVQQQLSGQNAALTALAGVYRGAANREGRHLEVSYELAARSRHSQQSLTF
jgi:hypothetical protein